MLAEPLAGVKRKQGDRADGFIKKRLADDGVIGVFDQCFQNRRLAVTGPKTFGCRFYFSHLSNLR